ncbi:MAG: hypothetical protein VYA67_26680 [Actinomycetota bacterium]|nr:hypothetical protein [Actinomycetota bacterium]
MITRIMRLRATRWAPLIAAALCVLAVAALAITVPAVLTGLRARAPLPDAPGLAALSGRELAELLPRQSDFPAGWTRNKTFDSPDQFGYGRYHSVGAVDGYQPVECYETAYGIQTGSLPAATVAEHDPADPPYRLPDSTDIQIAVGREFNSAVFDDTRTLVSRCSSLHNRFPGWVYTVRILEDSRPPGGLQRFRYTVTTTDQQNPADTISTDYYSYVRMSGLMVSGNTTGVHQQMLDTFVEDTLRRVHAADHR